MYRYYFSDHLWKADLRVEGLSLDEQVKSKLMELLYRLKQKTGPKRDKLQQ